MKTRGLASTGIAILVLCASGVLMCANPANAAPPGDDSSTASQQTAPSGADQENLKSTNSTGFMSQYAHGQSMFPEFWKPYTQQKFPEPVMENSPRLRDLIHDGKLELSLQDAIALELENNLDIMVQRYVIAFSQTDILRSKSGQANRGFTGATQPTELNSGAIGAGITSSGSAGGTGNAGGITGGGGPVSIGSAGSFDPTFNFSYSWDRAVSPLNSIIVSGIPDTTSYAQSFSETYSQLLPTGFSYSVSLSALRQSTTQENILYNPDVASRLAVSFNQPLLNSFGLMPNERFILVAENNIHIAEAVFRLQVVTSVVQLEQAYWNLAAFQENVRVAEQSLAAANRLLADTKRQYEIGRLAHLDLVTAESAVAAAQRDLIVAQTNLEEQSTSLKQLISKKSDPALDSASVVLANQLPEPRDSDLPVLEEALATAFSQRPELDEALGNLRNQDYAVRYTKNNQLPSVAVFGLYASAGLQGNDTLARAGAAASLNETFTSTYPEYAYGLSFSASLRNRSAQADSLRSQMERNQMEVSLQDSRNQIDAQVRQAEIGLIQGKAQVEASHEAVVLAQETLDAEQEKLKAGTSVPYNVVLQQQNLVAAQYAEVQAYDAYANALVAMDQATGTTLAQNGIEFGDAVNGTITRMPTYPFNVSGFNPGQGAGQGVGR